MKNLVGWLLILLGVGGLLAYPLMWLGYLAPSRTTSDYVSQTIFTIVYVTLIVCGIVIIRMKEF